jgi:hypothetical protein
MDAVNKYRTGRATSCYKLSANSQPRERSLQSFTAEHAHNPYFPLYITIISVLVHVTL